MYMDQIFPMFVKWVDSVAKEVPVGRAQECGQYFLANYVDAVQAHDRGAVYNFYEKVLNHVDIQKLLQGGAVDLRLKNMATLAKGVVWAAEHDGFDSVKYEPITEWGMDIQKMKGKSIPV